MSQERLDLTLATNRPRDRAGRGRGSGAVLEKDHCGVSAEDVRAGRRALAGRIAAVPLCVAMASLARGDAPLTTADLVRFLKASISERTILLELQSRGFGEPLDLARETTLREAGATETLIVAVRRT